MSLNLIIIEKATGNSHRVEVVSVEATDYKYLTKKRYFFHWKDEKNVEVYKLRIINSTDILGLISLERIPNEWRVRIRIRLLTISVENQGKN